HSFALHRAVFCLHNVLGVAFLVLLPVVLRLSLFLMLLSIQTGSLSAKALLRPTYFLLPFVNVRFQVSSSLRSECSINQPLIRFPCVLEAERHLCVTPLYTSKKHWSGKPMTASISLSVSGRGREACAYCYQLFWVGRVNDYLICWAYGALCSSLFGRFYCPLLSISSTLKTTGVCDTSVATPMRIVLRHHPLSSKHTSSSIFPNGFTCSPENLDTVVCVSTNLDRIVGCNMLKQCSNMILIKASSSMYILQTRYPSTLASITKASSERSRARTGGKSIGTFIHFSSVIVVFSSGRMNDIRPCLLFFPLVGRYFADLLFLSDSRLSPGGLTYQIPKPILAAALNGNSLDEADAHLLRFPRGVLDNESKVKTALGRWAYWFRRCGGTYEMLHSGSLKELLLKTSPVVNATWRQLVEPYPHFSIKGLLEHLTPYRHRPFSLVPYSDEPPFMVLRITRPIIYFSVCWQPVTWSSPPIFAFPFASSLISSSLTSWTSSKSRSKGLMRSQLLGSFRISLIADTCPSMILLEFWFDVPSLKE
nr:hypothetical protein [Tanacetum cinerariifolium]